ncbi:MAG TPA: ABC transporter permease [Candidatus Acidoferrum sp.]|jgi:predicted permease
MAWTQRAWLRLQTLVSREKFRGELDREMDFHLDEQIAENVTAGMNPEEARCAAIKSFGNRTLVKEETRDTWGWIWLEQITQDVRYAARQLRKTSGFTTTAILTLALGIGANAAIFSLVNAVLMKNLPVADPKTLLRIGDSNDCCVNQGGPDDGNYALFSTEVYEQLKENLPEFADLAAMQAGFGFRPVIARRDKSRENARSVMGEFVSGNYFRTFGLQAIAGRLISDTDDVKGAPMVAVMSYEMWKRSYAGEASVIGSTFWINTKAVTIAGIAPAGFYGDRLSSAPPDFYFPIETMPELANVPYVHDPNSDWLYIIGRLKPGVQTGALQEKVSALVKNSLRQTKKFSSEQDKKFLAKVHVVLAPGGAGIQALQEQYASNLRMLMAVSGLVLLIACANIANLLLVRGMRRKVEMSVRTALGAARGRIVRQLLTESVLLAGLGGIAGLAVAFVGTRMLLTLAFPGAQSLPIQASPSAAVLAFACALSLLTGILFGLVPAWIAGQAEPADALRGGARMTTMQASLLQRGLVVLQAALSLVLLVGAGLFSQSLNKLQNTNLKLDSKNRYVVHINPQAAGYTQRQLEALYRTMEQRFHALPGVKSVGISSYTPMEDNNWSNSIQVQGQPDPHKRASVVRVNPEYFNSVGTHVVMGRGVGVQDTATAPAVAVVNETFVKNYFPAGSNPIGGHFGSPGPNSSGDFEIVGVVDDTVYTTARWRNHRMYFLPMMQRAPSDKDPIDQDTSLYAGAVVVETQGPMNNMEEMAQRTLSEINPNLAVVRFQTFEQQIAERFNDDRLVARLTALFGGLALLLATIGLYGVTAYTVARRASEIGIRMAMGAQRSGVIAMVMRRAMSQTALGLAIGIPAALLCARFIETQLFEVKAANAGVLVLSVVTLVAASSLAGLVPARRAASIDPAQTLRTD